MSQNLKKLAKWISVFFILVSLIFCAWSVINHDIYYYTDIGRDFLIFDEITAKKIIFLGPRANTQGLFHGILWHYLNIPAYLIGQGNPIIVGWFWYLLTIGFFAESYYVVKNLFDKKSAVIALLLLTSYMVPYTQGYMHGNGAMLILPLFFYLFIRYIQTEKGRYLLMHLLIGGCIIQFELAVGIPLCILSVIGLVYFIFKKKKFSHIIYFPILIIPLSTFLLFDLRHNFLQLHSLFSYILGARDGHSTPFIDSLNDRVMNIITRGFNFFTPPFFNLNLLVFVFFLFGFFRIYRKTDKRITLYTTFLYFFIGYWILTLIHGGHIIMFWWLPLTVLPLLIFSTLHLYIPKRIYYPFLIVILVITMIQNVLFIKQISENFGKTTISWRFYLNHAIAVFSDAPKEFGYFIYSPDIFGYQDKYAMLYAQRLFQKKAYKFTKKQTTYVLIEPPPTFRTDLKPDWWIKTEFAIDTPPIKTIPLAGGYKINKYQLSEIDLQIPSKITPSDWLFYR